MALNKEKLAAAIAAKGDLTKAQAAQAVSDFVEVVTEELASGGSVRLGGLFTLSVRESAARNGRNPQTGATITIAARKALKVSASSALKEALNK
jgi:DNA-binding protein HU-beta